ncbi:MAG: hypothetical protein JWQ49_5227 [Edaphobacter sp.]|nr:hypothetical protein [Edaphobacter sp.]
MKVELTKMKVVLWCQRLNGQDRNCRPVFRELSIVEWRCGCLAQFHLLEVIADDNNSTEGDCNDQVKIQGGVRQLWKSLSYGKLPGVLEYCNADAEEKTQHCTRGVSLEMKRCRPSKVRSATPPPTMRVNKTLSTHNPTNASFQWPILS